MQDVILTFKLNAHIILAFSLTCSTILDMYLDLVDNRKRNQTEIELKQ